MAVAALNRETLYFLGARKNIWVTFAIRKISLIA